MTHYRDDSLFETDEDQCFDFEKQVLQMLCYDRIDLSERIDVSKTSAVFFRKRVQVSTT